MARCRAGDELAWESLVRQYQGRVHGLARHYVGPEDARDVAQEVFVRVYRNRGDAPEADRFLAWLLRIGRNACIDWLRRRQARPPARDVAIDTIEIASTDRTPEEEWDQRQRRVVLERAMDTMTDLNREVIVLREIQRLSVEDTARTLGIPEGTVKSRAARARLELARAIRALASGGLTAAEEPFRE